MRDLRLEVGVIDFKRSISGTYDVPAKIGNVPSSPGSSSPLKNYLQRRSPLRRHCALTRQALLNGPTGPSARLDFARPCGDEDGFVSLRHLINGLLGAWVTEYDSSLGSPEPSGGVAGTRE